MFIAIPLAPVPPAFPLRGLYVFARIGRSAYFLDPGDARLSATTRQEVGLCMKADELIRQDVTDRLRWHSGIDATDIAVKVRDGVVTLTGYARNYYEKSQAEELAKEVVGVAAVAVDVQVRLPATDGLTGPEIARAAVDR